MMSARWWAPVVVAAALGVGAVAMPAPARAQPPLGHVVVDIADVVLRGGVPYYRYGDYGPHDRLIVQHGPHGHATYYRAPYPVGYAGGGYGHGGSPGHGYGGHGGYGNAGYVEPGHGYGHGGQTYVGGHGGGNGGHGDGGGYRNNGGHHGGH